MKQKSSGLAEVQVALSRGEDGTGKYLSCTPSTLRQIAERRPTSLEDLMAVQGMGAQKVERFGAAFLALWKMEETYGKDLDYQEQK